ncbi:MAG: ferredoxin family protein [Deferrisomatales bacterium]|nr:ferredoxin family protein [Deferrisomatales bacterium]
MPRLEFREERCKSCALCVEYCPRGCLEISERLNPQGYRPAGLKPDAECTGCAICARMCPDVVIEVWK